MNWLRHELKKLRCFHEFSQQKLLHWGQIFLNISHRNASHACNSCRLWKRWLKWDIVAAIHECATFNSCNRRLQFTRTAGLSATGEHMKNFIFISPNFPENYWRFCRHLRNNGFNVLGIGDCEYFNLLPELKQSLTEYYKVSSLENYDEVFRAVAFFTFRYGKIDWLESNHE